MSKGLIYCHMCGQILDDNSQYQIVSRESTTRKQMLLFDVCPWCAQKVANKTFKMPLIKNQKKVSLYTIQLRKVKPRTVRTLYSIFAQQLYEVLTLEIPVTELRIRTKSGKRYWLKHSMEHMLKTDDEFMLDKLLELYTYQTKDEKNTRLTVHDNAVGFNKPDADFLSGMAKKYQMQGLSSFTEAQLDTIRKKMEKYAGQLTLLANANVD